MSDNRDAINDILSELERQKEQDAPEAAAAAVPEPEAAHTAAEQEYEAAHEFAAQAEQSAPEYGGQQEQARYASPEGSAQYYGNGAPAQPRKKKRRRKKQSSRLPGVLILTTLIFGVSVILSLVIISFGKDMIGIGKSDKTQLVVIPEGYDTEQISILLEEEGIIRSPKAFQLFARLRKNDSYYISGQHFLRPNMAYETIIAELTTIQTEEKGESIQVTFPEGITLIDAAQILQDEGVCDSQDFIFYFNSGGFGFAFEDQLPLDSTMKFEKMEGYLFPDTYFFYQNSNPEEVCQKIYYNFNEKMTPERLAKMKELGLSLDQLVTFASIVQAEAPSSEDMVRVASVFWNRLEHKEEFPKLESDPTSNYANDVVRPNMEYFDEAFVNAYDTYKTPGLPPGAICNPGTDAIDAVLAHQESNNYYFCANIYTKETFFAETLEQHEANLAERDRQYAEMNAAEE